MYQSIKDEAAEAVEKWIDGTLTAERSWEIQTNLQSISAEAKVASGSSYWEYLKITEVVDLWCDLIRNGLVDSTPYSRGKVLYLTLKLVEGRVLTVELASKMILHTFI